MLLSKMWKMISKISAEGILVGAFQRMVSEVLLLVGGLRAAWAMRAKI